MPIVYEAYDGQQFGNLSEPLTTGPGCGRIFGGLSPFDLPNMVEVLIDSPDTCTFRFRYPDDEPRDAHVHALPGTDRMEFIIGKESKKILEVHLKCARDVLERGSPTFDSRLVFEWCRNAPERVQTSCTRNATVVSNILESIPADFRREILHGLTQQSPERARYSWLERWLGRRSGK